MENIKNVKKIVNKNYSKFKVSFNTIDKDNPKAISIIIKSWFKPVKESNDYNKDINKLGKDIKKIVYNNIDNELFKDRLILDLDIKINRVRLNKKSFMTCEIILFTKDDNKLRLCDDNLNNSLYDSLNPLVGLFNKNKTFDFSKIK